jgi:regulator of protease activity HflC (stomatin/prohibitin superfamily)
MSDADQTPQQPAGDGVNSGDATPDIPAVASKRPARQGITGTRGPDDSLEQANKSLGEALKVTFRLLQVAMIVLAALYVLSGFQSVRADERGVRVVFGRATATDLMPGFQFSWPYPVGEMVKVSTGVRELKLFRDFWPFVAPGREESVPVSQLRVSRTLSPAEDGSLLTADGNLVHTRWVVNYAYNDAYAFASTIHPPDADKMVQAAVKRGVVRAVSEVTIDELLKQSSSQEASVARRAQRVAQQMLDEIGSGIRIDQLSLNDKVPPMFVREKFAGVQSAASNASKVLEDARREANELLNRIAGSAAVTLGELIDEYELHIESKDDEQAVATLAQIFAVMEGSGDQLIAGEVASALSMARQERSQVVSRARSDARIFAAKLEEYRGNPVVMVSRDWTEALEYFMSQENVRVFTVPQTGQIRVLLNSDPEVDKQQVQAARREQAIRAAQERELQQQIQRRRSNTGIQLEN